MARIFIAIRFTDAFKKALVAVQDSLKERGVQGSYCPYGNLHMTLAFIGEAYDLPAVRKAVSEVKVEPFDISLWQLGSFPTKEGVIWCGVKDGNPVIALVRRLRKQLKANGVSFKETDYFPHISLVQHPTSIVTDIDVPEAVMQVGRIHILKSERIEGELIYSEIG